MYYVLRRNPPIRVLLSILVAALPLLIDCVRCQAGAARLGTEHSE
jgi:hypothetical protein